MPRPPFVRCLTGSQEQTTPTIIKTQCLILVKRQFVLQEDSDIVSFVIITFDHVINLCVVESHTRTNH